MHSLQLLIYDCEYPRWSLLLILPNVTFFYFLFFDFYKKAYVPQDKKKDDDLQINGNENLWKKNNKINEKDDIRKTITNNISNGKLKRG